MEYVSGKIKLRDIFLSNGNWWKVFIKHRNLIRFAIIANVLKLLVCRTRYLGYHRFLCPKCYHSIKVPHSCKSRFCSSCGKKATDNWIKNSFNKLPHTKWQHITFTMPDKFWDLFWLNRHLMNKAPALAANIIKKLAAKKNFLPGIYLAVHTFGRDLKRNFHLHLSTTAGGLSLTTERWISGYFYHESIKKMWRYEITMFLKREFKAGRLKMPSHLKHIRSYTTFCSWINQFYNKNWVVHLDKQTKNMKQTIEYLGKYLKRPALGETRIKRYDGKSVTFEYLDHYTDTKQIMTLPAEEFICRLISHIPDNYFRSIRYYGFLANRVKSKLMPIVYNLIKMRKIFTRNVYLSWRDMIQMTFKYDPLKCPNCHTVMRQAGIVFPVPIPLSLLHKEIAHGLYPLL